MNNTISLLCVILIVMLVLFANFKEDNARFCVVYPEWCSLYNDLKNGGEK